MIYIVQCALNCMSCHHFIKELSTPAKLDYFLYQEYFLGLLLAVWWLRLHASNAGWGWEGGSILVEKLRSRMPCSTAKNSFFKRFLSFLSLSLLPLSFSCPTSSLSVHSFSEIFLPSLKSNQLLNPMNFHNNSNDN